jgi:hypothetical protein
MSNARIVVLAIALGAGGLAASLPAGSAAQAKMLAQARQTGAPASALRGIAVADPVDNLSEDQASRPSESVNGVRQRVAILTTAQK